MVRGFANNGRDVGEYLRPIVEQAWSDGEASQRASSGVTRLGNEYQTE